ncbi:MAG: rhodanese-like domain-containing protein [Campylobacterales bacterium]|nr:rhodanese-like domain-containing protein [Campylobacterales bacterium]
MKKILLSTILTALLGVSANAYDADKAKNFDGFFSKMTQEACANSKLFIDATETMKMIKDNEDFLFLDVRTKGEHSVLAVVIENSIHIPLEDLFKKESLDKLPKDKTIVITCHSGTRATMAAMSLKQVGFKQTRVLKGGLVALADANDPKNAPVK